MYKKMKEKRGITLIALVVTIIILLILAGVTIGLATNGTGLFEKAKLSVEKYNNAAADEGIEISKYVNSIEDVVGGRDLASQTPRNCNCNRYYK